MTKKTNVLDFDLSPASAKRILSEISKESSRVFFTDHAEKRMKKRSITRMQVVRCLRHGKFSEGPYLDIKCNWKFNIDTFSAGEHLTVVGAFERDSSGNFVVIITAYNN